MTKKVCDWPRLSETLPHKNPECCGNCGATEATVVHFVRWQEHDEFDRVEPIMITLCVKCSDKIIDPHPRLYTRRHFNHPMPGGMECCGECTFRDGFRCAHKNLKANGGEGLILGICQPTVAFIDGRGKDGKRTGWRELWYERAPTCTERNKP
jgi:hypothetical protein